MTDSTHEEISEMVGYLTNCLVYGEHRLDLPDGRWVLGLIRFSLGGFSGELRQQPWVIQEKSWRNLDGQWRHTTNVHLPAIAADKADAARTFLENLAELLSFATTSEVAVAGWDHEAGVTRGSRRSTSGTMQYFLPVIDTHDGEAVRLFLECCWDGFLREREQRNLPAVFHYLALAERKETPVEAKLAILFIVLEQLKHSFAVTHGYPFFAPHFHVPGTTTPSRASARGLKALLGEMMNEVGMSPSLGPIVQLRNEILHSGLSTRPFPELMKMEGAIVALIREYLLRLLGFRGTYYTGESGGVTAALS
jgi:hypothetical protein